MNVDLNTLFASQFKDLSGRHPGMWPILPRVLLALGVSLLVVVAAWFLFLSAKFDEHEGLVRQETQLRDEYKVKIAQAVNLEALQRQRQQADQYVELLEKQLPSKAEMAALLSDINQAGIGRGLQFELFKPGEVVARDYYAELPIVIKVSGSYHDIGSFAGDMANLPRIVTLNNMRIESANGTLVLDAIAKTFRYLDQEELDAQRDAKKKSRKGAAQ